MQIQLITGACTNLLQLFSSIPEGFTKYGKAVKFIEGTATALEPTTKTVTIESAGGSKKIVYDTLVIATGGRTIDSFVPWKSAATGYKATKENLHKTQKLVEAAESIVIGGAGPTGVETAGELGFEYGKTKKITLVGIFRVGERCCANRTRSLLALNCLLVFLPMLQSRPRLS